MDMTFQNLANLRAVLCKVGGLAVLSVAAVNVLLHPGLVLLLLLGAAGALFIFGHADLGVWLIVPLTPVETLGPLNFALAKPAKLALTVVVTSALFAGSSKYRLTPVKDPYRWPFFLVFVTGFFATLLATSPFTSAVGLASILIFVLYYTAALRSAVLVGKGPQLLRIVLWGGVVSSALCLIQLIQGYNSILASAEQQIMQAEGVVDTNWPTLYRGAAAFNGPSAAGAFLGIATIVALAHAQVFRKWRTGYFLAALACLVGVLATFSRGALLGSLAGFVFSSWAMGFLTRRHLLILGSLAALALPWLFATPGVKAYLRLGTDLVSVSESRVDAWQAAFVILKRHPVFGIGFYEFQGISQGIEGFSDTPLHPHNGFLKALVEQGPLGGCAYLFFLATFLRTARKGLRQAGSADDKWVLGSIAGAGISLFTQELFDANLTLGGSSIAILFATLLGIQVSLPATIAAKYIPPGEFLAL